MTTSPRRDELSAFATRTCRPPGAWVRPVPSPAERAAELAELERLATRDRWRDLLVAAIEGAVALGVGLYLLGWSMHTTDDRYAQTVFWGGLTIGNTGLSIVLIRAHARAQERGDL